MTQKTNIDEQEEFVDCFIDNIKIMRQSMRNEELFENISDIETEIRELVEIQRKEWNDIKGSYHKSSPTPDPKKKYVKKKWTIEDVE